MLNVYMYQMAFSESCFGNLCRDRLVLNIMAKRYNEPMKVMSKMDLGDPEGLKLFRTVRDICPGRRGCCGSYVTS
jgi:hypothetical protein